MTLISSRFELGTPADLVRLPDGEAMNEGDPIRTPT